MNYFVIILIVSLGLALATAVPINNEKQLVDLVKDKMQKDVWNHLPPIPEALDRSAHVAKTVIMDHTIVGEGIKAMDYLFGKIWS
ncbi:unnamed protein product [Macrosiphum euphorbiae]|uniref:Uncharacterized protein n=1 Tax=Macrosiphum euphorbiae TaxID=13131 RepID=A0AAV0X9Z8_9HEMI|nr:unnamed protein product [Macrosiphum euphorbiae]